MVLLTHFTVLATLLFGWTSALAEGEIAGAVSGSRLPRGIIKRLKCKRFGNCGGGGGYGGYGGQQGYPGQVPAINIGISQSQSSASAGSGGYGSGYYPNYNQYNNQGPYGGYNQGPYGGYNQGPYGGYNQGPYGHYNQGSYGGYNQGFQRPHYGNDYGGYNSQFNGNYYGGGPNGGQYGFQGPYGYGDEYSEDNKPENELGSGSQSDDYSLNSGSYEDGQGSYATSGSTAYSRSAAGSKN